MDRKGRISVAEDKNLKKEGNERKRGNYGNLPFLDFVCLYVVVHFEVINKFDE